MLDENATQQGTTPRIVLENVSAAIVVAEELLNSTKNVHEFNAELHRSQELLQESDGPISDQRNSWAPEEYTKAKESIAPGGDGLGRRFIAHFMPSSAVPSHDTLQNAIVIHYQERWRQEGEKLLEQSQLELWKGKEANDAGQIAATKTVHEFNALFKRSRGMPTLLQKSQCSISNNVNEWHANEYEAERLKILDPG